MRRIVIALFFALIVSVFTLCFSYGAAFETNRYDVTVEVFEDNSWQVTETIQMNFIKDSHGIFRYIPYKGYIYYEHEGQPEERYYKTDISDLKIPGYYYEQSYENNSVVLKIGEADVYVKGPLTYEISYKVTAREDGIESFDQFYWGLLPTDWNTSIDQGSFRIIMPGAFMSENMEFISGAYGSTDTELVNWSIENDVVMGDTVVQVISGEITRPLMAGEGVTLRILLPEGYFSGEKTNDWMLFAMILLIFISPAVSLTLWFLFGRDPKVVRTVEFYPPEGIDSAKAGYIIDGYVDSKDMVGLILEFANKGYLIIEEDGKDFILRKNKALPTSAEAYERTMFDGLFEEGGEVSVKELSGSFYPNLIKAQNQLQKSFVKKKKQRIFTRYSLISRFIAGLLMIMPLLAFNFLGTGYVYRPVEYGFLISIAAVTALVLYFVFILQFDRRHSMSLGKKIAGRIIPGVLLAVCLIVQLLYGSIYVGLPQYVFAAVAASLVCFTSTVIMKKRTAYGASMLGKILGLKEFIRKAELNRIKQLVHNDPAYFYNTLPYAYVFGITDVFAEKFESLALPPPDWYRGSSTTGFSHALFMSSFTDYSKALNKSISVPPTAGKGGSSGSFSGGGGFSGGGMGGGGGGGW